MDCAALLTPLIGALFWGLPFAAVYWIRRRKKIAGASLSRGRLVLILWAATFPVALLSFVLGVSKLEGNDGDSCWPPMAAVLVLVAAYVLLIRSLKAGPGPAGREP